MVLDIETAPEYRCRQVKIFLKPHRAKVEDSGVDSFSSLLSLEISRAGLRIRKMYVKRRSRLRREYLLPEICDREYGCLLIFVQI